VIPAIFIALTGCAGPGTFTSYPEFAGEFIHDWQQGGQLDRLQNLVRRDHRDRHLYLAEEARLAQINSEFASSQNALTGVIDHLKEEEMQAKIRLGETLSNSASLLSNESVIPYRFAGYERVLVYHFQALNYLGQGNPEGAAVELRRAREEQTFVEQQFEKDIEEAYALAEERELDLSHLDIGVDTTAGEVKRAFQNAYTFLMSAIYWETRGDLNAALVDYKKALEINPENTFLKNSIDRLSQNGAAPAPNVWFFYEEGLIAPKQAIELTVPNYHGELISIAMPHYPDSNPPRSALRVTVDEEINASSSFIADLSAMARRELKARMPILVTRQILRSVAKYQLQEQLGKNMGDGARLIAALYSAISERADLRSWSTLPDSVQALPLYLETGNHSVQVHSQNGAISTEINLRDGDVQILRIIDIGDGPRLQSYPLFSN